LLIAVLLAVSCAIEPKKPAIVRLPPATQESIPMGEVMPGFSYPAALRWQKPKGADGKEIDLPVRIDEHIQILNQACTTCHDSDSHTMHSAPARVSCVDCHGGNWNIQVAAGLQPGDPAYQNAKNNAHVHPRKPALWPTSANPEASGATTLEESADYIRFINPGDLRAANASCGACHADDVKNVHKSMMAHGAMLWSAALYNNGAINRKTPTFGESYAPDGTPQKIVQTPPPTTQQFHDRGILSSLWPLPRWEASQPGNILRVFERGAKARPQVGLPDRLEDPGKPDVKLSVRGFGTDTRTDPVFIGLQKTRLLDPTLSLPGTNDHPGDFRGSGCTACHVVYANDSSPIHSGLWAKYGNRGVTATKDTTVPKEQAGHPIQHKFVRSMPTSTCIVCHIHPGTNVVNAYLGFTWWDNETEGRHMYPSRQKYPTPEQEFQTFLHNPEGSAVRGLWSNLYPNDTSQAGDVAGPDFLENLYKNVNPKLGKTQFADFHGHGWVFRAVYKQDRHGNLLDAKGNPVSDITAAKLKQAVDYQWTKDGDVPADGVPVHLKDIHLEMGMHCSDCHFRQDNHGDGNLYGETRNAVMIECIDCHGSMEEPAKLVQYFKKDAEAVSLRRPNQRSQKAEAERQRDLLLKSAFSGNTANAGETQDALKKFKLSRDNKLTQTSNVDPDNKREWTVKQTAEATSRAAQYAHTIRRDGKTWGKVPTSQETQGHPEMELAHGSATMSCYACHTSWNTSCFGCHLPMRANQAKPMLHNEGLLTRNYTNYNFQTLRDDVYMLGIDSTVKGNKVVPIRSACAVLVSSQDANRQWLYAQQQTVSAEGYSGQAFSPYFPHTVRTTETKKCSDCHISSKNDNNAIMAQLLLQGTNSVNFIGRFVWVGLGEHGLEAVAVTERDEPQAVIGSRLHEIAYPDYFREHQSRGKQLTEAHEHHGTVLDLQLRGEYVYAACGEEGFIAYDVANIDNKGFSERIVTAPVSPLGQQFYVKTKYATSVCSPSTLAIDPTRPHLKENQEQPSLEKDAQPIHPIYAFLYVTDKYEGLVVIGNPLSEKENRPGVATLLDGNPDNNYLRKALSFNPGGRLNGAKSMTLYGTHAFVCADSGLALIDLNNPLAPTLVETPGLAGLKNPRKVAFQFRYGFVIDDEGLKVIDITDVNNPKIVPGAHVEMHDARDIYVVRTYAYIAAGHEGLAIVDVEKPETPGEPMYFKEGVSDATAVKVGMTNSCLYAYVADGHNGLKVLQLTSAETQDGTPGYMGFSPKPSPRLIATYKTAGHAIAVSEGLDRDRAVDESGNQLAVFGRKGARPMRLKEQQRLYLQDGKVYTVSDDAESEPVK
jgi:hypothetical protein